MNTTRIVTGIVSQFNPARGFGIALIDGVHPASISLTADRGPFVIGSGEIKAFFTKAKDTKLPEVSDLVTIEVYTVRGLMGVPVLKAARWCHEAQWREQEQLVNNREKTRPARSANFMRRFAGYFEKKAQSDNNPHTKVTGATIPTQRPPKPFSTVVFSTSCHA
jgi:hypothetical protein